MSGPFPDTLWLVPFSVFIAGIIGSPHCVSMCGPLVVNFASRKISLLAYQLGRMCSYVLVGALVGQFGKSLLGTARPQWLIQLSLVFIAITLFINASMVFRGLPLHFRLPRVFQKLSQQSWSAVGRLRPHPTLMATMAGMLTVFLPCGHLYSFLLGAVATGSALKGAGFMFAFWLGSTPLLSFGAGWLQRVLNSKLISTRRWASALLFVAGIFSLASFASRTEAFANQNLSAPSSQGTKDQILCH